MPWGKDAFLVVFIPCCLGFVTHNLYLAVRTGPHTLQGTNIVEDREIRQRYCSVTEGVPRQHDTARITKYTGALASPEWEDSEPGRVFGLSWYLVKSAQSQKDRFETLCCVMADLSSAPHTSMPVGRGKMAYRRDYDVILLVGLTELKAQIGWIDSETVRAHLVPYSQLTSICINLG